MAYPRQTFMHPRERRDSREIKWQHNRGRTGPPVSSTRPASRRSSFRRKRGSMRRASGTEKRLRACMYTAMSTPRVDGVETTLPPSPTTAGTQAKTGRRRQRSTNMHGQAARRNKKTQVIRYWLTKSPSQREICVSRTAITEFENVRKAVFALRT